MISPGCLFDIMDNASALLARRPAISSCLASFLHLLPGVWHLIVRASHYSDPSLSFLRFHPSALLATGAERRSQMARRFGWSSKRDRQARSGSQRSGDPAQRSGGPRSRSEAEGTGPIKTRRSSLPLFLLQPRRRFFPFSASMKFLLALRLARAPKMSTPRATASAYTNQTRPSTPPQRLPSHWTTAHEDQAERHRWDDLDLQLRIASREPAQFIEHELLLEAQRKFSGGVGSAYGVQWAKLKAVRSYDKTLSLVICGHYPRREDLARCGFLNFSCHDRLLCPRCCSRFLGKRLADEFGNVALRGMQVFYICISLTPNPDEATRFKYRDFERADRDEVKGTKLATPCDPDQYGIPFQTMDDVEQARLVCNLISEVIHDFTGTGKLQRFLGVVGGPELAVQFNPLRVLPHCNFIIWSDSFTVDDARELRRLVRQKMRDCRRLKLRRFPSVACYGLRTRDDVRAVLSYSLKPIDLAAAYTRAAERVDYVPSAMTTLNADAKAFLNRLPDVFHQLPRVTRHGCCHPNARGYIGHTTAYRAARREREAERRRALRQNGSKGKPHAKISSQLSPHKRRRSTASRFYYWRRHWMPGPPPHPPINEK